MSLRLGVAPPPIQTNVFHSRPVKGDPRNFDIPPWAVKLAYTLGRNWKPHLLKDPRNAARILKRLRVVERKCPPMQQYLFLIDFLDWWETAGLSLLQQRAVLESGFQTLLFAILLDRRTFAKEFEGTVVMNQARFLGLIFTLVLHMGTAANAVRKRPTQELLRSMNSALDRLNDVVKLIWDQQEVWYQPPDRTRMLIRPSDGKRIDLSIKADDIAITIVMWSDVYKDYRKSPMNGSYIFRILFHLWVSDPHHAEIIAFLTQNINEAFSTMRFNEKERKTAMADVIRITTPQTGPFIFISTSVRILREEMGIMNSDLANCLSLVASVCLDFPQMANMKRDVDLGVDIFKASVKACHRQLCHGSSMYDTEVLCAGILLIRALLQDPRSPHWVTARTQMDKLNVPTLISTCLLWFLQNVTPQSGANMLIETIVSVMETHLILLTNELRENPQSPMLPKLKRTIRKVWYPTLQQLRHLRFPIHIGSISQRPLAQWIELGKLLGLDEKSEKSDYVYFIERVGYMFPRGKTRRCHWLECLCSNRQVEPRHAMRVCKGCRMAYYCSSRCQRSDWEDGHHREECEVLRSQRQAAQSRS
ncbi:hypothetical protein K474DRAFT_1669273 [Panus rudis PR-1116 ss-1]|nr:hypothetical protein K474DRAFT_1669273 [Panus rudis PR-1116 ss-1]